MNRINGVGTSNVYFNRSSVGKANQEKEFSLNENESIATYNKTIKEDSIYNNYVNAKNNSIFKSSNIVKSEESNHVNGIFEASGYRRYQIRQKGETVFDLTKLENKLTNKIAFPEVEMYNDDYNGTIFRSYLVKPNSNELIRVTVRVPEDEYPVVYNCVKYVVIGIYFNLQIKEVK